jgi:hypothetical protein
MKENKRNFSFISFQQFFGNWAFQRVTADSNRKNSLLPGSRHRLREEPFLRHDAPSPQSTSGARGFPMTRIDYFDLLVLSMKKPALIALAVG